MLQIATYLRWRLSREEGATMIEYGLVVVGIAVVVAIAAAALGGRVSALFDSIIPGGD